MNENVIKNPNEAAADPVKKELSLFYVVDSSGSMSGERINTVNNSINISVAELRKIDQGPDANVKVATLKFDDTAEWVHAPMSASAFNWTNIRASGSTSFGRALKELDKIMHREAGGYLTPKNTVTMACPVIILMSDGGPTDDWKNNLQTLKNNKYFSAALKFAIAIGKGAVKEPLIEFTGNSEAVFEADEKTLGELIKVMSYYSVATSSKTGGQSPSTGSTSAGDPSYLNKQAQQDVVVAVKNHVWNEEDF